MRTPGRPKHLLGAAIVVVACLVLALATSFAVLATPGDEPGQGHGYPQRIGFERPSPKLPERAGHLAATLRDNNFGGGRGLGVTSSGDLYELPYGPNVLSPDGRLLLTGEGRLNKSRLVVHDLVTGEARVMPRSIDSAYRAFWSADGSSVVMESAQGHVRLLDVASGDLVDLGKGRAAGFLDTGEAVTVRLVRGQSEAAWDVVVSATDVARNETSRRPLPLQTPWPTGPDAGFAASVSPEGTLAMLASPERGRTTLQMFSLEDGAELPARTVRDWDACAPTWLDGDPVVPTATRGFRHSLSAGATLVTAEGSRPLVAVHFRMQSSCLLLTPQALAQGPHRELFGTTTAVWTWYWWQLLLVGLLALVTLLAAWWAVRSRRLGRLP